MSSVATQFKKGQSGNLNGRPPKGYSVTEWFKDMFQAHPERRTQLGELIYEKALAGDPAAYKLVWNYMDGMPQQDVTSGGEKIEGVVIYTPEKNKE